MQLRDPEAAGELAADRQPGVRRQRRIIGTDHEPSGASGSVNDDHPLGGVDSPSTFFLTTRTVTVGADGKPRIHGAFPTPRQPRATTARDHNPANSPI